MRAESKQIMEAQIESIWGSSLGKLEETASLALQRIEDAQERLESVLNGQPSLLYLIVELGYKSVRLVRVISCLCRNGYADEAYSLCRNLMELEANIWFIMVSGDAEGNCKRYLAWDNAKFYRYVRENRTNLDPPPSEDEWAEMTKEYRKRVEEYGEKNLKNEDAWAIALREQGSKEVKAQNVTDRALHSMPYLADKPKLLHEGWKSRWDRLNSMAHNSPRSIMTSLAAPREKVVVTGQSALGMREPIKEAARMILNISSSIANNISVGKTEKADTLGKRTMESALATAALLEKVPVEANPWWQRNERE